MTLKPLSPEVQAQTVGMAALLALAALGLGLGLALPRARTPEPIVVEVRGDVPAPGFYALEAPATVADALAAAGASAGGTALVQHGDRLALGAQGLVQGRTDAALILGEKLALNQASAAALEGLPGIGARRAADIVADREAKGPYPSVDALDRVRGIGPATVERLRPFLQVEVDPTR